MAKLNEFRLKINATHTHIAEVCELIFCRASSYPAEDWKELSVPGVMKCFFYVYASMKPGLDLNGI